MLPHCSHSCSHIVSQKGEHEAPHITRKRGVYYYRRRLPAPHRGEVAVSLSTANYREAEHLAALLDNAFHEAVTMNQSNTDIQAVVREYLKEALRKDFEWHLKAPPGRPVYRRGDIGHEDPLDADLELISHLIDDAKEALARRDFKSVSETVEALIVEHGLSADQRSILSLGILHANVKWQETSRRRLLGEHPELDPVPAHQSPTQTPPSAAVLDGPTLSIMLPDFIDYMVTEEGWRGTTTKQSGTTYRLFLEWCGDKPLQAYTRKDTAGFFDMLRKLPALYSKDKRWRDLSLVQIMEASRDTDVERLTMKTVKRHFSALGRLFDYAKKRGQYEGENPGHGFDFPTKGRGKGHQRRMWEGEPLHKLFASPVWTGCHARFRTQPGDKIIRDDHFWLPILGLFHGNRLEEFAQLRREDVKQEAGIWFFDIHDAGERQLKNEQSVRRVPLHPIVLPLGFLAYLDRVAPNPNDRLFPELRPGGPDKKVGYYFTKWWTNYRRAIGVYEKGLDYHSFRHGVTTKLFTASVPRVVVDELTGHEGEGTSQTVYMHKLSLKLLAEAIAKVNWPEVDLSALRA